MLKKSLELVVIALFEHFFTTTKLIQAKQQIANLYKNRKDNLITKYTNL